MRDLSAAERIAAEAIARRVLDALLSAPTPFQNERVRQELVDQAELDAEAAVAALSAAGWLVEPVERACGLAGCTSCAEQLPDRSRP